MAEAMSRRDFNRSVPYDAKEKRGYVAVFMCSLLLIALIPWYTIPELGAENLDDALRYIITVCYFVSCLILMVIVHSLIEEHRETRLNELYWTHLEESD